MEILKRSLLFTMRSTKTNDTKNEVKINTIENTGAKDLSKKLSVSTKLDEILKVDDGVTSVDSKNSKTDYSEYTRSEIYSSKKSAKSLSPSQNSPSSIQHSGGLYRQYELSSLPSPPQTNERHIPNLSPITPAQSSRKIESAVTPKTTTSNPPISTATVSDVNKNKLDINQLHLLTHEPHPNSYSIFSPTRPTTTNEQLSSKDRVVSTLNPDEMTPETHYDAYSIFSPTRPISTNRLYFINDNKNNGSLSSRKMDNSAKDDTTSSTTSVTTVLSNAIVNNTISPREGSRSRSYLTSGEKTTATDSTTSSVSRRPSLSTSMIYIHSPSTPSRQHIRQSSSIVEEKQTPLVLPVEEFSNVDGTLSSELSESMSKMMLEENEEETKDNDDANYSSPRFHITSLLSPRSLSHSPTRHFDADGDDCYSPISHITAVADIHDGSGVCNDIVTTNGGEMYQTHHPTNDSHYHSSTLSSLRSTPGNNKMSRLEELKLLDKTLLAEAMQDESMIITTNNSDNSSGPTQNAVISVTANPTTAMKNKLSSHVEDERENKMPKYSSQSPSHANNHLSLTTETTTTSSPNHSSKSNKSNKSNNSNAK